MMNIKLPSFNKPTHDGYLFPSLKYFLHLIIITVLFSSCNKELAENLLGDLKNQNPFSGSETLLFIDNNGDSIVFYGDGRITYLFETQSSSNPRYYYTNESDACRFVERDGKYELSINLATHYEYTAQFHISMYYFDVENCDSHTHHAQLPLLENYEESNIHLAELEIRDRLYTDVFRWNTFGDCTSQNEVMNFYYCISHGVIKIEFEDDIVWELEKIEW